MNHRKIKLLFASLCLGMFVMANPPSEEGKALFTSRCASCHNVNKSMTGPALAGVDQRRTADWIVNFIQSPQSMIKKGDKDAVALYQQFNKIVMPDHADLSKEAINNILEYIRTATTTTDAEKAPFPKPGKKMPAYLPLSITGDFEYFIAFGVALILLIGAMLMWVRVKDYERSKV